MIPKNWLRKQVTLAELKGMKRIDAIQLPLGYTKYNIVDRDKSEWWNEPAFEGRPEYVAFVDDIQDGDEIWEYAMPQHGVSFGFLGSGLNGYALVRSGEVVTHFVTGA